MLPLLSSGKSTPNLELPILISWNMQQLRMVQAATFRVCYRTCQDGKSESITLHELQRFNSVNLFQATETNKNFETTTGILWKVALKDNEGFLCSSIQFCHTLHFHKKRLAIAHTVKQCGPDQSLKNFQHWNRCTQPAWPASQTKQISTVLTPWSRSKA